MPSGTRLVDKIMPVFAFDAATPSSATPLWVSMKGYDHIQIVIRYKNATTVTGTAVGLSQATAVAGTSAKTLGFTAERLGTWVETLTDAGTPANAARYAQIIRRLARQSLEDL